MSEDLSKLTDKEISQRLIEMTRWTGKRMNTGRLARSITRQLMGELQRRKLSASSNGINQEAMTHAAARTASTSRETDTFRSCDPSQ